MLRSQYVIIDFYSFHSVKDNDVCGGLITTDSHRNDNKTNQKKEIHLTKQTF